jgi:hypothetical protein
LAKQKAASQAKNSKTPVRGWGAELFSCESNKEEEVRRKAEEEEVKRKAAEEEAKREALVEEEKRKAAKEEAKRKADEEEAKCKALEEEKRKVMEEEAKCKAILQLYTMPVFTLFRHVLTSFPPQFLQPGVVSGPFQPHEDALIIKLRSDGK